MDLGTVRAGDAAENPRRLPVEGAVQFSDARLPGPRQRHDDNAAIGSVPCAREEPVLDETGNGAADPTLVEPEPAYECGHRERATAAELRENVTLRHRGPATRDLLTLGPHVEARHLAKHGASDLQGVTIVVSRNHMLQAPRPAAPVKLPDGNQLWRAANGGGAVEAKFRGERETLDGQGIHADGKAMRPSRNEEKNPRMTGVRPCVPWWARRAVVSPRPGRVKRDVREPGYGVGRPSTTSRENGCITDGSPATVSACACHDPVTAFVPPLPPFGPMIQVVPGAMPAAAYA